MTDDRPTLTDSGRKYAESVKAESLLARVALMGYYSDWPVAHTSTAIRICNSKGEKMTDQPMASRFISNPQAAAEHAYRQTFEGPWGLKASTEDALASVLVALRPDRFPTSASAIYQIRDSEQLEAVSEALYEDECQSLDVPELIERLLPRLAEVLS